MTPVAVRAAVAPSLSGRLAAPIRRPASPAWAPSTRRRSYVGRRALPRASSVAPPSGAPPSAPAPDRAHAAVATKQPGVLNVAVVCGGPSAERGISLNSARSLLDHLQSPQARGAGREGEGGTFPPFPPPSL